MKKILFLFIILMSFNTFASNKSTIVMDTNTGRILYQKNANEKKLIASTTKIMTFVVAYEYGRDFLDVLVKSGDEVLKMYGTSIYLSYKEEMLLRDLLYGLMLRSGNDAAEVIAYFIGGNEEGFVTLMNKKAKTLGMNNTIFKNPHGLDENTKNYSTAHDLAILSSYASKIPFYREVTGTKYYKTSTSIKAYSWTNRNKMVFTYPYYTTGKTGYTPSAGKTFVSTAKKDDLELTIVTLNEPDIYEVHRMLYEEYFNKYKRKLIVSKNEFMLRYDNLYIKNNLYYPLKENEEERLEIKLNLNENIKGIKGELIVYLDNKEIIKEPVYGRKKELTHNNENNSFLSKIKHFFDNLF